VDSKGKVLLVAVQQPQSAEEAPSISPVEASEIFEKDFTEFERTVAIDTGRLHGRV